MASGTVSTLETTALKTASVRCVASLGHGCQESGVTVEQGRDFTPRGLLASGDLALCVSQQLGASGSTSFSPVSVHWCLVLCSPVPVSVLSNIPPPDEVSTGVTGTCVQTQRPLVSELIPVEPGVGWHHQYLVNTQDAQHWLG